MEKVFIHDGRVAIYCNSEVMEQLLRERGDRELSSEECVEYGIAGLEKYVTPQNTVVNEDGSITFTAPTQDEILKPIREDKLKYFDIVMRETDNELIRSLSDIVYATLVPAQEGALSESELTESKAIFEHMCAVQTQNRALRQQVLDAQSSQAIKSCMPAMPDVETNVRNPTSFSATYEVKQSHLLHPAGLSGLKPWKGSVMI